MIETKRFDFNIKRTKARTVLYRGYKDSINYKSCSVEEPKAKTSISGGSIESHLVEHLRLLVRPLYRKHEDNANGEEKSTETYGSRLSRL
ncbi:hypothetical protein HZH66_001178 [Vespula vulgaris]|uniref:Uncharacterized protein n=1 Tax=Vespula vulgaris TaxID=7454 RepID=A0A834KSU3_VESVU|nr:hypothetical protein HZH66_001178 [Vespula vulgaris]